MVIIRTLFIANHKNSFKINFMKKIYKTIPIIFVAILIWSCDDAKKRDSLLNTDKLKIERIHKRYVDGWLEMDKEKI